MAEIIYVTDLPTALQSVEMVNDMVAGANAKASRVAPCLASTDRAPSADLLAEAKLILLGAVKRWAEAGSGSLQSQNAGIFGMTVDTRQRGGFNFWPSEITDLQALCATGNSGAFSIDTLSATDGIHAEWCSVYFSASCSCGADIAGYPIFEQA